ncbi:MAG: DUF4131 domain-containing protein [Planctomycetes bacterium]|nr:DUF4131 domain-containing protein [Planctomycetota bacterium]
MDDIQQKLKLIDQQLSGGREYHRKIVSTTPALFLAIGLIAGIILQEYFAFELWCWISLLGICVVSAVLYLIFGIKKTNPVYVTAYVAMICFICVGGMRLGSFYKPAPDDIANLVGQEKILATIRGVIVTEPYVNKRDGWKFAKFQYVDATSGFYLRTCEVKTVDGWGKVSGVVKVYVNEPVLDLKAGDYIQADCWLGRFKGASNPGQFDTAKHLARKNVFLSASVKARKAIEVLESGNKGVFARFRQKLREKAVHALVGDRSLEGASEGLLKALLLGYRGDIDSGTYKAFRRTGLLHFISLSGMHLGIFVGIVWWLCKTAGLMKRWRAGICIAAVIIFMLIVPTRAPTLRAAIISIVFCVSFFFRRHSNPVNTLSLAAIILLLIRPTELFIAGWQLSFASVLGILIFTERIHLFLYEKSTGFTWYQKKPKTKLPFWIISKPGPYLLQLFSVGTAAWLGSAGVLLYHFYSITPLSSLWTVIAFPFVAFILIIGYLKLALALLLPTTAMVLGMFVNITSRALIGVVEVLAKIDISQILIGHVPGGIIIFYYVFILAVAFVHFRKPIFKKVLCTVMALVIIVFLSVTKYQRTYRDELIMTTLDVGHGQAIVVQLPGKANLLFDAGSIGVSDVGRKAVTGFLDYSGISKLDAIFISHGDIDHINGIPEIAEHCLVEKIYAGEAFFVGQDEYKTESFLVRTLKDIGLEVEMLAGELDFGGDAGVKMLWPGKDIVKDNRLDDNDKSSVPLIEYRGKAILLTSDIGKFAQKEIQRLYPELKPAVMVVPHHGSVSTLERGFLEKPGADILIYSCGGRGYKKLMKRGSNDDAKRFYTYRDGAIRIFIDNDGSISSGVYNRRK